MTIKKIEVAVAGEVTLAVSSRIVIEMPADVTDEEIKHLPEELVKQVAEYADQWEDGDGVPEDAADVNPTGDIDCEWGSDVDDDVEADCRLVRDADGKLVMSEVDASKDAKGDLGKDDEDGED